MSRPTKFVMIPLLLKVAMLAKKQRLDRYIKDNTIIYFYFLEEY